MPTLVVGVRVPYGAIAIPIELRLMSAYNPETPAERFSLDPNDATVGVDTSWTGQAWVTTGIAWDGAF
jgi:hypothetical protein